MTAYFKAVIPSLQRGKTILARNIEFNAHLGEFWCLLGPNGGGKTTLLHTLAGMESADNTHISINGQQLHTYPSYKKAQHLGLLPQNPLSPLAHTVLEGLQIASYYSLHKTTQIESILATLELVNFRHHLIAQLSGGEQQRFHIAMLLVQDPSIYLLDEPINHLDLCHQTRVLHLLKNKAQYEKKIIITSLHDINLAYQFADQVALIKRDTPITFGNKTELLTEINLSTLYEQPITKMYSATHKSAWFNTVAF